MFTAPGPVPIAPVPIASTYSNSALINNIYNISATTTDSEIPPPSYEEDVMLK